MQASNSLEIQQCVRIAMIGENEGEAAVFSAKRWDHRTAER